MQVDHRQDGLRRWGRGSTGVVHAAGAVSPFASIAESVDPTFAAGIFDHSIALQSLGLAHRLRSASLLMISFSVLLAGSLRCAVEPPDFV